MVVKRPVNERKLPRHADVKVIGMRPTDTIVTFIRRRRLQMMVHSYVYYELNDNVVSDTVWQLWAGQLTRAQKLHPEPIGFYDEAFADWDGSTGYHLPKDDYIKAKAEWFVKTYAK